MRINSLKLASVLLAVGLAFSAICPRSVYAANSKTDIIREGILRVYGPSRFETSFSVADRLKEIRGGNQFDTVIVTSALNFPDALAGSYLAAKKSAPILMADRNASSNISRELYEYVEQNASKEADIYILGGNAAVPSFVETEFLKRGYSVKRLAGKDRFSTNLAILEEAGVTDERVLLCTGMNFADSLSVSALGLPILLVNPKSCSFTAEQKKFLKEAKTDITIIGGNSAVSDVMEKTAIEYDRDGQLERISGSNRFETSVAVAREFGKNATEAVLAYAGNFPDGLCGGPLAYEMRSPLILTKTGLEKIAAGYTNKKDICEGIVLGGAGLISDEAAKTIFAKNTDGLEEVTKTVNYTIRVSTTLHEEPETGSNFLEVPYMTELICLKTVTHSEKGSWVKVQYDGQIYYMWQAAGTDYLTEVKSDFKYEGQTSIQQEVIDTVLNIFSSWDTKYAHNQSTGIKDTDGKYGFDCSGFVAYVLDTVMQKSVPTYDLSANMKKLYNTESIYNKGLNGEFIAKTILTDVLDENMLNPGDVLFFHVGNEETQHDTIYNHCGIYLGDGEFIHCSRSWGGGVAIVPLTGIYEDGFIAAKRYLPDVGKAANVTRYTTSQKTYVYPIRESGQNALDVLSFDTPVTLLFTDNGNWSYIRYEDEKEGFVLSKYLKEKGTEAE